MAGRLATASEVAGGHTLPIFKEHGVPILKWYGMSSCDLLRPELEHQVQIIVTRALNCSH
jgi:hypothetical protein